MAVWRVFVRCFELLCVLRCVVDFSPLKQAYQLLLEDHLLEPLEIQRLEGGEHKERVFLVALGLLDGSFWIRYPHGGFGPDIFVVTRHRGFV